MTRYIRIPLFLLITTLFLGFLSEKYVLTGGIRQKDITKFSNTLHRKQKKMDNIMNDVAFKLNAIDSLQSPGEIFEELKSTNELFEHKELSILVTKNNKLIYWSDHVVGFSDEIALADEGFIQLPNGWFVLSRITQGNYIITGLILIKYDYKIENKHLQNNFAKGFHLPNDFKIHFYKSKQSYPIYDHKNQFIFSIQPSGTLSCIYSDLYIPVAFYSLALLFLFILIFRVYTHYFHYKNATKLLLLPIILGSLYLILNRWQIPQTAYLLKLFSPKYFAFSKYCTSLGEFLLLTIFLFFFSINFFRLFDLPENIKQHKNRRKLSLFISLFAVGILFILVRYMIYLLIMNSSISFAVFHIEEVSLYSILGFMSIGFLILSLFFFAIRTTQVFRKHSSLTEFISILTIITILLALFLWETDPSGKFRLSLFYWIVLAFSITANKYNILTHRLSVIVTFVFGFSLFVLFNLINFVKLHENKIQELMVQNLSAEHDPTAELYLRDIDLQIKTDTVLPRLFIAPYSDAENYLSRTYFNGYLRQYDLQFTFCHENDSLLIQPENNTESCLPFFYNLLQENGSKIPDINFYYLYNMNGRITYFGDYNFTFEQQAPLSLFIELNSKLRSEGIGFPELLLPDNSFENRLRHNFSFAKYNNRKLVDRGGEFLYALTPKSYHLPNKELIFRTWNNHSHCISSMGNGNYIIVSRPYIGIYDYLIAFPYIFIFLFAMALFINIITQPKLKFTPIRKSLRIRIQLSIIGVVFIALLIVGSGTIYYIIAQYRSNHRRDLVDKINSVSVEIDMIMNEVDSISPELINFFDYDLTRISEITWTDINLYNLDGTLMATSRPEVFEKGLISKQMDNTAIHYLNKFQPTRFLHKEHIAKMEYLSAYMPLINNSGKSIGYINIPYFTKQREFNQEITTFILAFINIYVFLLLASIIVAYFISTRITEPLKLIRENLSKVQLGKNSQPINYNTDDEIGTLVAEYNSKVEELASSTDLLARSERETAWREMAKQIAHEIKNPLTPMKLNIQFLQRSTPSSEDDYKEKVDKVTGILIEQIDNLSAIATEFSNFAQIPKAHNQQFILVDRLNETIQLYNYTEQIDINTHFESFENLKVNADKEQFSRAIINLIKNAIQSIPANKKGEIIISLKKENQYALIQISDNGKGISDQLKDHIFTPNFTTKSSGTGMGLAITKNIVENFKGKIEFNSKLNHGTTFSIRIPLIKA